MGMAEPITYIQHAPQASSGVGGESRALLCDSCVSKTNKWLSMNAMRRMVGGDTGSKERDPENSPTLVDTPTVVVLGRTTHEINCGGVYRPPPKCFLVKHEKRFETTNYSLARFT